MTWKLGIGLFKVLWILLKTPSIHDSEFNLYAFFFHFRILCIWNRIESVLLKWSRLLNLYSFASEWLCLTGGMILAAEDGTSRTKTGPIASFFTTNSTCTGLDWNPGLHGERLVSNRLIPLVANLIYIQKAVGPLRTVRLHHTLYIRPVQMSNLTTVLCGEMCVWYTKWRFNCSCEMWLDLVLRRQVRLSVIVPAARMRRTVRTGTLEPQSEEGQNRRTNSFNPCDVRNRLSTACWRLCYG